jgi:3D (Asp-Asp-Asp) domain-containing protein
MLIFPTSQIPAFTGRISRDEVLLVQRTRSGCAGATEGRGGSSTAATENGAQTRGRGDLAVQAEVWGGTMTIICTAYCMCALCCPLRSGLTASGTLPHEGVTIAAPRRIPLGTWLHIEGIGCRCVEDRLARRFDNRIDIYFAHHADAVAFGLQRRTIRPVEKMTAKSSLARPRGTSPGSASRAPKILVAEVDRRLLACAPPSGR